ncbi:hypothetical protein yfred0001_2540 [Yersinia frederiksenii ATCC 33641]|nr:hypothetical protein yfred0001_2540 [Yersinia frederiksenii ATCC 33641]
MSYLFLTYDWYYLLTYCDIYPASLKIQGCILQSIDHREMKIKKSRGMLFITTAY